MRASRPHVLTASLILLVAGLSRCGETVATNDGGADAAPDADLTGTVGHPCFANQTCFPTLTCVSNVCVDLSTLDGGKDASDAGPDVADASDASDASTVQPILQWSFENNGDNTGSLSGYALSLNGSTTYVSGKFGQALQFGSGAYATVAGMKSVLGVYAQYTISFWLYVNAPNSNNALLDFENRASAPFGGVQLSYPSASSFTFCVASTTNSYLPSGNCSSHTGPPTASWHNVILSYAGTGTGAGQGADLKVFVDDGTPQTIANDSSNDPIFSSGISDTLYVGALGSTLDEIRVYATTFTQAVQCTGVIGGTWNGSSCTLP